MDYNSQNIKVLKGLEAIRLRPEMYIGHRHDPFHLYKEVIDNCVDEYLNGYLQDSILVDLDEVNNILTVTDSGRGLPIDIHKQFKKPTMEVLVTETHSGGKFEKDTFKVAAGLNGVGIKAVNALSNWAKFSSIRDGYEYSIEFKKGVKVSEFHKEKYKGKFKSGTIVSFQPDDTIFENAYFKREEIEKDIENRTYSNSKLKIIFTCGDYKKEYYNENGIRDYIDKLNPIPISKKVYHSFESENNKYEFVFNFENSDEEIMKSFVNGILVKGTCETGFKTALTNCIISYINKNNLLPKKNDLEIKGEDVRMGLVCLINIYHSNPLYKNQTKDEITNSDILSNIKVEATKIINNWLETNKGEATKVCNRIIAFSKGRTEAAKYKQKIIKVNNARTGLTFSSKLKDCSSNNPEERELFIVEGLK